MTPFIVGSFLLYLHNKTYYNMKSHEIVDALLKEQSFILQQDTELIDIEGKVHRIENTQFLTKNSFEITTDKGTGYMPEFFVWVGTQKEFRVDVLLKKLLHENNLVIVAKNPDGSFAYFTLDRDEENPKKVSIEIHEKDGSMANIGYKISIKKVLKRIFNYIYL